MAKLSSMIGFLCLIGCVYQIYDLTEFYLKYKVRRDVAYDYSSKIELPVIDIAIPMLMGMNLTKLFAAYPEEMSLICANFDTNDEPFNYTIDDLLAKCAVKLKQAPIHVSLELNSFIKVKDIKELTHDFRDQINYIQLMTFGDLKGHCNYTRYYSGITLFIRISCLNGTKPFSVDTNFISLKEGVVLRLVHSFETYFGIKFSDPTDLPVFEQSKYFTVTRDSFSFVTISFVKTVMKSLEYPYETRCRHYNKAKSISKCITEFSLGQPMPYLFRTLTYEWDEHPDDLGFNRNILSDGRIVEDESDYYYELGTQEYNAVTNCAQQASATECEKTIYLIEGRVSDEIPGGMGMISIEPSWKPNTFLSVHSILLWSEYVIFIGSILGIWFGISIQDRTFVILRWLITRFSNFQVQRKRLTKQMNTKLNENQHSICSQLKCTKKIPIFDGRSNEFRNERRQKTRKDNVKN